MQFSRDRRRQGLSLNQSGNALRQQRTSLLDMYESPGDIFPEFCSIEEFYQAAYDRLQLLQTFEELCGRLARTNPDFEPQLLERLRAKGLRQWVTGLQDPAENLILKKHDVMSHFTLRLAYCQNEELRRWFLQWETELFRFRLERSTSESIRAFQEDWKLTFTPVDAEEKATVLANVISARPQISASLISSSVLFKVHFTMVPDLVSRRKVFLRAGEAYLLPEDMKGIISSEFRAYISKTLVKLSTCASLYYKDEQVGPLLKLLARRQAQAERTMRDEGSVSLSELDGLSKEAYPMCMTMMHERLRDKHHLKHTGRLALCLFLKGIGLSLDDSLTFFGEEFAKSVGQEKFSKEYAYSIRHSYGKEGKRADYRPYNCLKMINLPNPSSVECHGCPFKVLENDALKMRLRGYGLGSSEISDIMADVKSFNYQSACTKVFEGRTKKVLNTTIVHPNQYFEESLKVLQGTSQLQAEGASKKTIVNIYSSPSTSKDMNVQSDNIHPTEVTSSAVETAEHNDDDFEGCFDN